MNKISKKLKITLFGGIALFLLSFGVSHGALPGLTPFYLSDNGTNWITSVSTYELGSSTNRIAKIWATAIDTTTISIGGATPFTTGSVIFAGASGVLSQDNANLFWDDTNNRLGIGTTSPIYRLDVIGTFHSSGYAFIDGSTIIGGGGIAGMYPSNNSTTLVVANGDLSTKISIVGSSASPANNIIFTNASVESMRIDSSGYVGIQQSSPTARLHLGAGSATASTAPLKFTSGTNLATPETGAVEYDGTNLFFTRTGTTRETVSTGLRGSDTLDFPNTNAGTSSDLTITVTGASDGDVCSLGVPNGSTVENGSFTCWVSASNTVTVRYSNNDLTTSYDPASGTFKVTVEK